MRFITLVVTVAMLLIAGPGSAQDKPVNIRAGQAVARVGDSGLEISRIQDSENVIAGEWARTSRACPPFCIQPMRPAAGVTPIGELELIDLLSDPEAVVIDSRTQEWFDGGSIPGALNIPYTEMVDRLGELGCEIDFEGWECEHPVRVALFCNGPWCGQSPTAIRRMIEAGCPPESISYYRGGMQVWRLLGLSVTGQ
jgi:rhodanese-related sulfurtransferase